MLNKLMLKQKVKQNILSKIAILPAVLVVFMFVSSTFLVPLAKADQFEAQINALNNDSAAKRAQRNQLGAQASTLEEQISKLQTEINGLQAQINAFQAQITDLQNQITTKEQELEQQRKILGQNIKAMYLEGETSTLVMLASSKDLSDFVDKAQYRNSVQNKVKTTMDKITELKQQMRAQKEEAENALKDKQAAQGQLDAQQGQLNGILSANESQQAALNSQIRANSAAIAELRKQQIAANSRFIGGSGPACGGGYPGSAAGPWGNWGCNYPLDNTIDNWGMYNRECVSYTAFKVAASGRHMPYWGGHGNANQWDDNARASGIPTDSNPRPGDVAISNAGFYGHAMYVEAVNPDGTIFISQYNASFTGTYSTKTISPAGLVFIHFR